MLIRGFSFNHNGATSSNFIIADLGMSQSDLLALLVERGLVETPIPECDLVASAVIDDALRAWVLLQDGSFQPDRMLDPNLSRTELEALVDSPGDRVTLTCTPWGSGQRIGIDRDEDGTRNGDEV